ncbi:MAG: hypothetical protein IJF84_11250 [Thermoguttaceae bacterium]|nr:hypothetical protein [Thermoguttaceae bacterium]
MRFAISTFLTIAFIFGFAIAQEDQIPDTILPDELETVEPLDDSEILDSSNPPEEVQPFTEDLEEAVPENPKPNNASPSQAVPAEQEEETEQPEQTMLPEGISEEEARWANWADWDNVGAKPDEKTDTVIQQDLIAPQTDEDAIEDSSRLMDQSAVPEINKNPDVTRQISVEPETDPFETTPDQKTEGQETQNEPQEDNSSRDFTPLPEQNEAQSPSASETSVSDLIEKETADTKVNSSQKIRYLESFSLRQDKPAKINDRISKVVEKIKVVRRQYFDKQLNTEDNSPFEAMMSVCAFGCYTSIYYSPQKESFNTAGALCWNYPMCETSILAINPNPSAAKDIEESRGRNGAKTFMARYPHGRLATAPFNGSGTVFPYIGYCQQERSGEFLSMLAIARVSVDYEFMPRMAMDIDVLIANEDDSSNAALPVHSSGLTFTVADLVSDAMTNCRGGDMSALLTSLSYYVPRENWKNAWGEEWSVLRILDHELKRKVNLSDSDSTDRLYGLTYALRRRLAFDDRRLESQYAVVDEYLERMKEFALSIQNEDGSFNGAFFTRQGKSRNPDDDFAATAHFARWLTILYHSSALDDPRLTRMIEFLVSELEERLDSWNPSEMSQKDVRAVAYALQAIAIYQQRWAKQ